MKITESYFRKIIRGTLNEMFSGADASPSFHDMPPEQEPSEMVGMSSAEIVDHIMHQYSVGGQVDSNLLSLLQQIKQNEEDAGSNFGSQMTPAGLGENKKKR
jgi:hypothetical protein